METVSKTKIRRRLELGKKSCILMLKLCPETDRRVSGVGRKTRISQRSGDPSCMKKTPETRKDSGSRIRRWVSFHMTRLIDQWSFNAVFFLVFLKLLQLCKLLGAKPTENGWRKVTGIFLKGDISKFMLGIFRVTPYPSGDLPSCMDEARERFLTRFAEFLRAHGELHWAIMQKTFRMHRRRLTETDLLEVEFRQDGTLENARIVLDPRYPPSALSGKDIDTVLSLLVRTHNRLNGGTDPTRSRKLYRIVKRRVLYLNAANLAKRMEAVRLLRRMMNASCVTFLPLPEHGTEAEIQAERLRTPDVTTYRHPGWGLLNVFVRIHPRLGEADLWIQYHHVPVDGMAMQEVLTELKTEWGEAGKMSFPAPGSPASEVEIQETPHKGLFRARAFFRFDGLLELRRRLNQKYAAEMRGPATIAGMILWGLAKSPQLHDAKMLFPVDVEPGTAAGGNAPQRFERELSLVFIRPSDYMTHLEKMGGFILFQREFNRRLKKTRYRCSETYEMLELLSMIHPLFYYYAKYLMPKEFHDVVGTFGLSVLRHAEVFIAPVTDLQIRGFLAFGRMDMPCEGGGTAGCVSICGTREQIEAYLAALERISGDYQSLLGKQKQITEGEMS